MPAKQKTFEVGLVMAGAVSAGAYTAGVMDFLLMALEDWYAAKQEGKNVPNHDVCIKVMTGASAGGMTTALTTVEMIQRAAEPGRSSVKEFQSKMYEAWVNRIDISELLKTNDLKDGEIKSLLDSSILDTIADEVLNIPAIPKWKGLPYVEKELKLFLTLSNLRGLPYDIKLNGQTGLPHGMSDHADYQYLKITDQTDIADWIKLRNAAIATGAFPVGLAPRLIERDLNEYKERISKDGRDISGLMKVKESNKPYTFVAVDGGLLNNEPIELARSVWQNVKAKRKETIDAYDDVLQARKEVEAETLECPYALILIDPFPDQVDLGKDATPEDATLMNILGPIIGALRSQSLFKVEELLHAADESKLDRFLISPIRYTETNTLALNALACGFFAGFGGFMSHDFRHHDYELGKRNCQRFLKEYFTMPIEDAEKLGWYAKDAVANLDDYLTEDKKSYQILPIIKGSRADAKLEKVEWPAYTKAKSEKLKKQITTRVSALLSISLPLSWTSKRWTFILIILLLLLAVSGEFVKAAQAQCGCEIVINGLKNSYILILQAIFFLVAVALIIIRFVKRMIAMKLVKGAHGMILKYIKQWGIRIV